MNPNDPVIFTDAERDAAWAKVRPIVNSDEQRKAYGVYVGLMTAQLELMRQVQWPPMSYLNSVKDAMRGCHREWATVRYPHVPEFLSEGLLPICSSDYKDGSVTVDMSPDMLALQQGTHPVLMPLGHVTDKMLAGLLARYDLAENCAKIITADLHKSSAVVVDIRELRESREFDLMYRDIESIQARIEGAVTDDDHPTAVVYSMIAAALCVTSDGRTAAEWRELVKRAFEDCCQIVPVE